MSSLILLNKPFKVLSQFTDHNGRSNLSNFINKPGYYPAGRLDYDSEGLLLLTNNGNLQHYIAHPTSKLSKTYWVQVEGAYNQNAVEQLQNGVLLKDGITKPAKVKRIEEPTTWDRNPPVRYRQSIPTHWLEISITEGRNRQVRRMTAAVNLPTLRLIRRSIGDWNLENLMPGEFCIKAHSLVMSHTTLVNKRKNSKQYIKYTKSITSNKNSKKVRDIYDK